MINVVDISKLPLKGICNDCNEKEECPMVDMLRVHRKNQEQYGEFYQTVRPDLWDMDAIDEPEFEGNKMEWCPLYSN